MIKEITKTKFKQPSVGWCAVYTLANVLNNEKALEFIGQERFKGCSPREEEEILRHLGYEQKISQILFSSELIGSPTNAFIFQALQKIELYDRPFVNNIAEYLLPFLPIFLCVRLTKNTKFWHRTAVIVYRERFFYTDPYRSHIVEFEHVEDLDELFYECSSIERMTQVVDGEDKYTIMFGHNLQHNWLDKI